MSNSVTPWLSLPGSSVHRIFLGEDTKSGLLFPSPGDFLDPGIEFMCPVLVGEFFTTESPGKPMVYLIST